MNALDRARESINELLEVMRQAGQARMAARSRQRSPTPAPRATRLLVSGNAMIRVVDADTGKTLGFRQTIREARWLAERLERGAHHSLQAEQ